MIERLLELREMLFDTAEELYGPSWITNRAFWKSITQRQLMEVTIQLDNMGYDFPEPSDEEVNQAKNIAKDLDLGLDFED